MSEQSSQRPDSTRGQDPQGAHLRLFTAQLATLLVVELLPDGPTAEDGHT